MTNPNEYGWAAQVAAEIGAEKRTKTEAPTVVEVLKSELVKARLALSGVTDPKTIAAVAARMTVNAKGDLIGIDAKGNPGVGTGYGCHLSVEDVAAEVSAKSSANPKVDDTQNNPFAPGKFFNVTEQMILRRADPAKADHLEYLAGMGRK